MTDSPRSPENASPLSSLKQGQRGRMHSANLPCEDCDLLNAMGMTESCEIRVCRRGNPCIVQQLAGADSVQELARGGLGHRRLVAQRRG